MKTENIFCYFLDIQYLVKYAKIAINLKDYFCLLFPQQFFGDIWFQYEIIILRGIRSGKKSDEKINNLVDSLL